MTEENWNLHTGADWSEMVTQLNSEKQLFNKFPPMKRCLMISVLINQLNGCVYELCGVK